MLKLEDHLETTTQQVDDLQARLNTYFKKQTAGLLRQKWEGALASWQKLQKEAEDMREELVEDKYLTVYRTVSRQAEDMMQSLEKVFAQCNTFVHVSLFDRQNDDAIANATLQRFGRKHTKVVACIPILAVRTCKNNLTLSSDYTNHYIKKQSTTSHPARKFSKLSIVVSHNRKDP